MATTLKNASISVKGRLTACLLFCFVCSGCDESVQRQTPTAGWPASFNFGRPASPARIAAWDIDVRPDGEGLPAGSGTAIEGQAIYAEQCASCHGATGTEGPHDRLVGRVPDDGFPFGEDPDAWNDKTIGGYWPYATTLWDYIRRAMPQHAPGSLTSAEVYALTAFLLHRNAIISRDAVMNEETLPRVEMPARDRFVPDDRLSYQEVH